MKKFIDNDFGAAAVEFAVAAPIVILFLLGIMQTAYVLWVDNLLHYSVDVAARCGAIGSCDGATTAAATFTAMMPVGSPSFNENNNCSGISGTELVGTYRASFLFIVDLSLKATSCYPSYPS